jgi:phenylalanyl-tRNA synthetase beta chain
VVFELDLQAVMQREVPAFDAVPRQLPVVRDLALVADETLPHDTLMAALCAAEDGLVRSATLFDVYKPTSAAAGIGDGQRSLAVRLELLDDRSTLTDERIEAAMAAAIERAAACGARLRT